MRRSLLLLLALVGCGDADLARRRCATWLAMASDHGDSVGVYTSTAVWRTFQTDIKCVDVLPPPLPKRPK